MVPLTPKTLAEGCAATLYAALNPLLSGKLISKNIVTAYC